MSVNSRPRRGRITKRALLLAACASAIAAVAAPSSNAATRDVVVVGNAFGGTVSFLDGNTYSSLGSMNIAPDRATRKFLLLLNPINLGLRVLNFFDRNNVLDEPPGRTTVNLALKGRKPQP